MSTTRLHRVPQQSFARSAFVLGSQTVQVRLCKFVTRHLIRKSLWVFLSPVCSSCGLWGQNCDISKNGMVTHYELNLQLFRSVTRKSKALRHRKAARLNAAELTLPLPKCNVNKNAELENACICTYFGTPWPSAHARNQRSRSTALATRKRNRVRTLIGRKSSVPRCLVGNRSE